MHISFELSQSALKLESERAWEVAPKDEFFICFESRFVLANEFSQKIELEEAALLGITFELLRIGQLLKNISKATISDFYGSYNLKFENTADYIRIKEDTSEQFLIVKANEFETIIIDAIRREVQEIEERFPRVVKNSNWHDIKSCFKAHQ